jgi:hypothetical protein
MSAKYYTHFIAQSDGAIEYSEYRGVVELLGTQGTVQGSRDIARMLARSFDLEEMDIQVLQHQLALRGFDPNPQLLDPLAGFTSLH